MGAGRLADAEADKAGRDRDACKHPAAMTRTAAAWAGIAGLPGSGIVFGA
jgi:hypothetical protein